ncbi:hypothetical protein ACA30_10120 [Virgibacillus soli]|nr:hypothetical protein ACA30_10120 [Virgibacillus soli]
MKNKKDSEIDFVSSSSFQKSIRKTKWKQLILYTFISIITLIVFIFCFYSGTQYLINKKIDHNTRQSLGQTKGAGISNQTTRYYYNTLNAIGETTYYKKIGNRNFVWNTERKKYPAIGRVEVLSRGSGMTEINEMDIEAQRVVRYNQLNNERIVDFYYPRVEYDYLPNELDIAVGLDKNKLIEVALSFNKPMSSNELAEILGYKNVDWLWTEQYTEKQMKEINKLDGDSLKVKNGDNASGFSVTEKYPYEENLTGDTTISGAIISGTPQDLERFQNLDIIRASVIGVTIDKY